MEAIKEYINKNQERFISELMEWLRIPSVSADSKYKGDVAKAAEFVSMRLTEAGATHVEICPTNGHPIVYGEKFIDAALPTVIVYGHYDVQPPDPLNLWDSPPFEPVIKDEKIYARGSCDDKGQVYMHVKALEMMTKNNWNWCNLKFMIEGEEEVGSVHLGEWVAANKSRLTGDVILISDTGILANDLPSIETGLRGLCYMEVEVIGPDHDLHSGIYGGAVANPVQVLAQLITSCKDENNHITIPGFYDDVVDLTAEERAELARTPFDIEAYKKELGINEVLGETGYTTMERTGVRPTFEVNGMWGGYIGEGAKTVLPSKANAKISMRLVPNQKSGVIEKLFTDHFNKIAPPYVTVKVTPHHGGEAYVTDTKSDAYHAAAKAIETSFGKKPIPTRSGGSIPIVALFEKELGLKSVLMGFGLDSDLIHSPNEHFGVFNFLKGIETIPLFYKNFYEMNK